MALASSAEAAACWDGFVASEDDLADLMHESRRLLRCPGGGRTHFIALGESPSCRLECLALAIAEWHCQQRAIDLSGSGAEWWVQVREPFESLSIHWDCDECLKSETGRHTPSGHRHLPIPTSPPWVRQRWYCRWQQTRRAMRFLRFMLNLTPLLLSPFVRSTLRSMVAYCTEHCTMGRLRQPRRPPRPWVRSRASRC